MEGFATWLEETLSTKLSPLEHELQAQQSTLRDLLATVTTLKEASQPGKAPLATLPKSRASERPRPPTLPKKGDEEQKSNKPVKSLGRTSSTGGLRPADKKSPDQDKDKAGQIRKSVSSAKLLTNKTRSKASEEKKTEPEAPVEACDRAPSKAPAEQPRPNYEAEIEELQKVSCIGRSTE
jgi:hypothetical protein